MFQIIYKGIIIGILVSAPIGPVGFLCIQKTLYKGRWYGFFSGLGASFSDFLYAIIVCMSIEIVDGFVEKNRLILQFLSNILLIIFGVYFLVNDPFKNFKKKKRIKSYSYWHDILSVFLLSFSNPFIILLYIGLFDIFNFFLVKSVKIFGIFCIFVGNVSWWFVITYLVDKLRKFFNIQKLYIVNVIIGIITIFFGFWNLL